MNKYSTSIFILFVIFLMPPSHATGKKIIWEKINPLLKEASSVGFSVNEDDQTECLLCHEKYIQAFGKTKHARYLEKRFGNKLGVVCEVCHGPMSKHLDEIEVRKINPSKGRIKQKVKYVVSFKTISSVKKNAICLQCHEKRKLTFWKGSVHEMMGVSCDNCHYVMSKRGKKNLLISEDPKSGCFLCHQEKRAAMLRSSHMPLKEKKLECGSCHNPHGGFGPSLLKRASINETCFQCHQEKRGPFIWAHAPVQENCNNCHEPHGTNFRPLLKQKPPFLCQQCHMNVFHVSDIYDRKKLRSRDTHLPGKACLNCHSLIHGSNHPSGARFQR